MASTRAVDAMALPLAEMPPSPTLNPAALS
jgi:hypothetical protein